MHFVVCEGTFFKLAGRTLFESCERASVYEWQDESLTSVVLQRGRAVNLAPDRASPWGKA